MGVVRLMHHRGSWASERNPHFDALPESIYEFERQIAANIYVRMPARGGELLLWPSPELRAGESIDNPSGRPVRLRPQVGDLVLFNSRKAHGTARFARGTRISAQCFIAEG